MRFSLYLLGMLFSLSSMALTLTGNPSNISLTTKPLQNYINEQKYISPQNTPTCQVRMPYNGGRDFLSGSRTQSITYPLNAVKNREIPSAYLPSLSLSSKNTLVVNPQFWETSDTYSPYSFVTQVLINNKWVTVKVPKDTWRHYVSMRTYAYINATNYNFTYNNNQLTESPPPDTSLPIASDQVLNLFEFPGYNGAAGQYQILLFAAKLPAGIYYFSVTRHVLGSWSTTINGTTYCGTTLRDITYDSNKVTVTP